MRLSLIAGSVAFTALLTSPTWADGLGRVENGVSSANSKDVVPGRNCPCE
jgi:hypothetical protein